MDEQPLHEDAHPVANEGPRDGGSDWRALELRQERVAGGGQRRVRVDQCAVEIENEARHQQARTEGVTLPST